MRYTGQPCFPLCPSAQSSLQLATKRLERVKTGLCTMQAKTLLLKASPFNSLEALLSLFEDLDGGTGVMYVRAQRQRLRGDLVPHVVSGCKDVRDQETGKTLRAYLGQTYLFHKAFKCVLSHSTPTPFEACRSVQ